jgi:hypothetical protein
MNDMPSAWRINLPADWASARLVEQQTVPGNCQTEEHQNWTMSRVEEYLENSSYKNVSQQYAQTEHNHQFPIEKMEQQVQQRHYSPESSIGSHILPVFYNKVCDLYIYKNTDVKTMILVETEVCQKPYGRETQDGNKNK